MDIKARLSEAEESWARGDLNSSRSSLEKALEEARRSPYQIKFRTRVQLATMLAGLYLSGDELQKARDLLSEEAKLVEPIFQFIQTAGTAEQKRAATGDFLQLNELVKKVSLIGKPAPEIKVKEWINSAPLSLEGLRGRVVLLEFWATWCKQCEGAIGLLRRLNDEYAASGLTTIALTRYYLAYPGMVEEQMKEIQLVKNFVLAHGMKFPVGVSEDERTQGDYGAGGIPALVLIDRRGVVRYSTGGGEDNHFKHLLHQCLSESA